MGVFKLALAFSIIASALGYNTAFEPVQNDVPHRLVNRVWYVSNSVPNVPMPGFIPQVIPLANIPQMSGHIRRVMPNIASIGADIAKMVHENVLNNYANVGSNIVDLNARKNSQAKDLIETTTEKGKSKEEKASPEVNQPDEPKTRRMDVNTPKSGKEEKESDNNEGSKEATIEKSNEVAEVKSNEDKETDSKENNGDNEKSVEALTVVDINENPEEESKTPKDAEPELTDQNVEVEILPEVPKQRTKRDIKEETGNPESIETITSDDALNANQDTTESTTEEIRKGSVEDIAPLLEASFSFQNQPIEKQTENAEEGSKDEDDVIEVSSTEATSYSTETPSERPASIEVDNNQFVVPDPLRMRRHVQYTNTPHTATMYQAPAYNQLSNEHSFHQDYNQVASRQAHSLATPAYNYYTENYTPYQEHGNYRDLSGRSPNTYNYNPDYTQQNFSPENVQVGYHPSSQVYMSPDPRYYWRQTDKKIFPNENSDEKADRKVKEKVEQVTLESKERKIKVEKVHEIVNSEEDDGENLIIRLVKTKKRPRKVIPLKIQESAERDCDDETSEENVKSLELNGTSDKEKSVESKSNSKCNVNMNSNENKEVRKSTIITHKYNRKPRDAHRSLYNDDDVPSADKDNKESNDEPERYQHNFSNHNNISPSVNKHLENGHHKAQNLHETYEYKNDDNKPGNEERNHEHNLQHEEQIAQTIEDHPSNFDNNEQENENKFLERSPSSVDSRHAVHEHDHDLSRQLNLNLQPTDIFLSRNSLANVERDSSLEKNHDRAAFSYLRYKPYYRRRRLYDDIYSPYLDDYNYPLRHDDYLLRNAKKPADKESLSDQSKEGNDESVIQSRNGSPSLFDKHVSNENYFPKVNKPLVNNGNPIREPSAQKGEKPEPRFGRRFGQRFGPRHLPYYMRDLKLPYDDYDLPYHYRDDLYYGLARNAKNESHNDQNLIYSRTDRSIHDDNDSSSNENLLKDEHNIDKKSDEKKSREEVESRHRAWPHHAHLDDYYPDYYFPNGYYSRSGTKTKREISTDGHDKKSENEHDHSNISNESDQGLKNDHGQHLNSNQDLLTDEIHGHNLNVRGRDGIQTSPKRQVNDRENKHVLVESSTLPLNRIRRYSHSPHHYPSYHAPEYTVPNRPEYSQRTPSNLDDRQSFHDRNPNLSSEINKPKSRYGYPYHYRKWPYYPYYSRMDLDDDDNELNFLNNNEDDFHYGVARSGYDLSYESNKHINRYGRFPQEIEGRAGPSEEHEPYKDTRNNKEVDDSTESDQNKSIDTEESEENPKSRADNFRYTFIKSDNANEIDLSFVKTLKDLQNVCLSLEFVKLVCSAMTKATNPKDLDSLSSKLMRIQDADNPSWQPNTAKIPTRIEPSKAGYPIYPQVEQTTKQKDNIYQSEKIDLGRPNLIVPKHKFDFHNLNTLPDKLTEPFRPDISFPYTVPEKEPRPDAPQELRPNKEYYPSGLQNVPVSNVEHPIEYKIIPENDKFYIPKQEHGNFVPPVYPFHRNDTKAVPLLETNIPVNSLDYLPYHPDKPTSGLQNEPALGPKDQKPPKTPQYPQLWANPEVTIADQLPHRNRPQEHKNYLSPVSFDMSIPDQYKGFQNNNPSVKPYSYLPKQPNHGLLPESHRLLNGRPFTSYNEGPINKDISSERDSANGQTVSNKPNYVTEFPGFSPKSKLPQNDPDIWQNTPGHLLQGPHDLPLAPNNLPSILGIIPKRPEQLPNKPNYLPNTPEDLLLVPNILQFGPDNFPKTPANRPEQPATFNFLPEGSNILPEFSPSKPGYLLKVPDYLNQPKVLENVLKTPDEETQKQELLNYYLPVLPDYLPNKPGVSPNKPGQLLVTKHLPKIPHYLPSISGTAPNNKHKPGPSTKYLPEIPHSLPSARPTLQLQQPGEPNYFPNEPNNLFNIPGQLPKIPKYLPKTPDNLPKASVVLPHVPNPLPERPDHLRNKPGHLPKVPHLLPNVIDMSQNKQNVLPKLPHLPNDPKQMSNAPDQLPKIPDNLTNAPQQLPEFSDNLPKIPGTVPEIPHLLPQQMKNLRPPYNILPQKLEQNTPDKYRPYRPSDLPKIPERPRPVQTNLKPKYDLKKPNLGPLIDQSQPDYINVPELPLDSSLEPNLLPGYRPKKQFKHNQLETPYPVQRPYIPHQDHIPQRPNSDQREYPDHIPPRPDSEYQPYQNHILPDFKHRPYLDSIPSRPSLDHSAPRPDSKYKPHVAYPDHILQRPDFEHRPYPDGISSRPGLDHSARPDSEYNPRRPYPKQIPQRPHYVDGDNTYFSKTRTERYRDEELLIPKGYPYLPEKDKPNKKFYHPDFKQHRPKQNFLDYVKHPIGRPHKKRPCEDGKCYYLPQRPSSLYLPPISHPYGKRPISPPYYSEENPYFPYGIIPNGKLPLRPEDYSQTPGRFYDLPHRPKKIKFSQEGGKFPINHNKIPSNVGPLLPFGEHGKILPLPPGKLPYPGMEGTDLPVGQGDYLYSGEYERPFQKGRLPYRGPVHTYLRPKGNHFPYKYPAYGTDRPRLTQAMTKFNEDLVKLQDKVRAVEGGVIKAFVYMVNDKKILSDGKKVPIFDTNVPTAKKDAIAQYGHIYDLSALLPERKGIPLVYQTLPHMLDDILPSKKSYVSPSTHKWLSKIPFYRENFVPIFVCDCGKDYRSRRLGLEKKVGIVSQVSTGPSFVSTSLGISANGDKDRVEIQDLRDQQLLFRRKLPTDSNVNEVDQNELNETENVSKYDDSVFLSDKIASESGDGPILEENKVVSKEDSPDSEESTQIPNIDATVADSNEQENTTSSDELKKPKAVEKKYDDDVEINRSVIESELEKLNRNLANPKINNKAFTDDIAKDNALGDDLSKSKDFGYAIEINAPHEENVSDVVSELDKNVPKTVREINEGTKFKLSRTGYDNEYDSVSGDIDSEEMAKYFYPDHPHFVQNTHSAEELAKNFKIKNVKESEEVSDHTTHKALTLKEIDHTDNTELKSPNEDNVKAPDINAAADDTILEVIDKIQKPFSIIIPEVSKSEPDINIDNSESSDNNSNYNKDDSNNNVKVGTEESVTLNSDNNLNENNYLLTVNGKVSGEDKSRFEEPVTDSTKFEGKVLDSDEKNVNFDEGVQKNDEEHLNSDDKIHDYDKKVDESDESNKNSDEKVKNFDEKLINLIENDPNSDEKNPSSIKKALNLNDKVIISDETVLNSDKKDTTPSDSNLEITTPSNDQVFDETTDEEHENNAKSAISNPYTKKSQASKLPHKHFHLV